MAQDGPPGTSRFACQNRTVSSQGRRQPPPERRMPFPGPIRPRQAIQGLSGYLPPTPALRRAWRACGACPGAFDSFLPPESLAPLAADCLPWQHFPRNLGLNRGRQAVALEAIRPPPRLWGREQKSWGSGLSVSCGKPAPTGSLPGGAAAAGDDGRVSAVTCLGNRPAAAATLSLPRPWA